jgi:hypothetical protein
LMAPRRWTWKRAMGTDAP